MRPVRDLGPVPDPGVLLRGAGEAPMFSRSTLRATHVAAGVIGVGFYLWAATRPTTLLTPAAPDLRAGLIGLGVFVGVLLAWIEREAWRIGIGGRRAPSQGAGALIAMAALVGACGYAGDVAANRMWEWRAFHGSQPVVQADQIFMVVGHASGKSGESIQVAEVGSGLRVSLPCKNDIYRSAADGDRLLLPVETGGGGVRRLPFGSFQPLRSAARPPAWVGS